MLFEGDKNHIGIDLPKHDNAQNWYNRVIQETDKGMVG